MSLVACPGCKGDGRVSLNGDETWPAVCDVCAGAGRVPPEAAAAFDPRSHYGETPEQTAARLAAKEAKAAAGQLTLMDVLYG